MQTHVQLSGRPPLPLAFSVAQVWLLKLSPMDSSSCWAYSCSQTYSEISIDPLISKCLNLVPDEADTSFWAAQAQQFPWQFVTEPVLGT
jgi:hypothetical protein